MYSILDHAYNGKQIPFNKLKNMFGDIIRNNSFFLFFFFSKISACDCSFLRKNTIKWKASCSFAKLNDIQVMRSQNLTLFFHFFVNKINIHL